MSSCHRTPSEITGISKTDSLITVARVVLNSHPDRALTLTEGIDTSLLFSILPDTLTSGYFQTRADALLFLDRKDDAYRTILFARDKAKQLQKKELEAIMDLWLTDKYTDEGKYYLAKKYVEEALAILEQHNDPYQLARAYNLDGSLLSMLGDYTGSQKQFLKAVKLFEKQGKTKALGAVYINLGNNYGEMNDTVQALICYRKAHQIALDQKDTANYLTVLNNLGRIYQTRHPDSAIYYANKILNYNLNNAWSLQTMPARFQMANVFYDRKEFSPALAIYNQILDTCQAHSISMGIYRAYSGIGNVYEAMNRDKEALDIFIRARNLAREAGDTPTELRLLEGMLYMYKKAGNDKLALVTFERIKSLNDSIRSLEKQLILRDLELMYNNEKAEHRNDELNNRMLLMNRKIRTNYIILGITVLFILTLSGLLYFIYRLYRQRDDAYQSLIEKYRQDIQMKIQPELPTTFPEPHATAGEEPKTPAEKTFEAIQTYFETEKPWLNPQLKIEDIEKALRINRKSISAILNDHTGMRFVAFVNNYRVREALRLLGSPAYQNIKIEYIARESGFGSKVSFYTAFAQVTGLTPGSYREKDV